MSGSRSDYSVLMSVYKNDKVPFLNDAIASMVNQTVPFHDMVLVCDGPLGVELNSCIDAWRKSLGTKLNVVRLAENNGLGYALNAGLPECGCELVARMDSDDISRVDRCEKLLAQMERLVLLLLYSICLEAITVDTWVLMAVVVISLIKKLVIQQ